MKILESFSKTSIPKSSIATIGNFDGVHLGHQEIIKEVVSLAKKTQAPSVIITFTKHPSSILMPENPVPSICQLEHKIELIKEQQVDFLVLIDFDEAFASLTTETFLEKLKSFIHPSHLLLGYDAVLGKDRKGTKDIVSELGTKLGIQMTYLPPFQYKGRPISSTWIRQLIMKGNLSLASELLGRPYSIKGIVKEGSRKGRVLGFSTANLTLEGLCLPPQGVYAVLLKEAANIYKGVANLGLAPTIQQLSYPILETHMLDFNDSLYNKEVEVILKQYLRPEKVFASTQELQQQIQEDIQIARNCLNR